MAHRLFLTGMSGAGKSTVGKVVAGQLGWRFIDMDDEIEARFGKPIPTIFAEEGEPVFRAAEAELLAELLTAQHVVVSTGGGAVANDVAQERIASAQGTLTVWMHATAEELHARVQAHEDAHRTTARPMLAGDDPLGTLHSLLSKRQAFYADADVTLPVGGRTAVAVAADLVELVELSIGQAQTVNLNTDTASSSILVGRGVRDMLPNLIAERWPKAQAVWLGVDANVGQAHSDWLESLARSINIPIHIKEIPSGESSKSMRIYSDLLDWMLKGGVSRGDVAIALGGGVVGDLMGFAAATVLRGIGLVQIPTTLLSMVDSSVGGKTGINHETGKNLIGAFYQPPIVLVDPYFLTSLPEREYRSGFAEIIKHGVIQASAPGGEAGFLSEVLRLNASGLVAKREPVTSWVIRQNIALKASVVAADEREANLRQILNFGHTIGHGVEAAGYQLLHGEAVAVGMAGVADLAVRRGDFTEAAQNALLDRIRAFGLPTGTTADPSVVLDKMGSDKKKSAGKQNWVLPRTSGGVVISHDVPEDLVLTVLQRLCQAEL